MVEGLRPIVSALRDAGFRVDCEPRIKQATTRVEGPCRFEGRFGPFKIRGVLLYAAEPDDAILRELIQYKLEYKAQVAVLASAVHVPPGLRAVADALGIVIVEPEKAVADAARRLEEVTDYTVKARIDRGQAEAIFREKIAASLKGLLGGVFSGVRVTFEGLVLAYYKFRCYDTMLHAIDKSDEALESEETRLCFETATGTLVGYEDGRLVVYDELTRLGELDDDAIAVLEQLSKIGTMSLNEIGELIGGIDRARIVVDILLEFGLVEVEVGDQVSIAPLELSDYRDLLTWLEGEGLLVKGRPPSCAETLGPGFDEKKLDRIVSALGLVRRVYNVYYPIYIGVFRKRKNEKAIDVSILLDGVTGKRMEDFEELIADSYVVFKLDEIVNNVLSGKAEKECEELGTGSTLSQPQQQ